MGRGMPRPLGHVQEISENGSGENLLAKVLADEPLSSFCKRHLIRKTAFEKHPDGRMIQRVRCRDQSHILSDTQVHQTHSFTQYKHLAEEWRLDFFQLLAEVFHKRVIQALISRQGFLANEAKAFIEPAQYLRRDKLASVQRLPDFRILCRLAKFIVDLVAAFGTVSQITQHQHKQVLRVLHGHDSTLLLF